jgi:hypothetical protein
LWWTSAGIAVLKKMVPYKPKKPAKSPTDKEERANKERGKEE